MLQHGTLVYIVQYSHTVAYLHCIVHNMVTDVHSVAFRHLGIVQHSGTVLFIVQDLGTMAFVMMYSACAHFELQA